MRLRVDDEVEVIAGNDKGVRGKVQRVEPAKNRIVVAGVNVVKKHQKPQQTGGRSQAQGGIIPLYTEKYTQNQGLRGLNSAHQAGRGWRADVAFHLLQAI